MPWTVLVGRTDLIDPFLDSVRKVVSDSLIPKWWAVDFYLGSLSSSFMLVVDIFIYI